MHVNGAVGAVRGNLADAQGWQGCHATDDSTASRLGLWRLHLVREMLYFCCAFSPLETSSSNIWTVSLSEEIGYTLFALRTEQERRNRLPLQQQDFV